MINIVHNATLSLIPENEQPPAHMMGAFMLVHKVHSYWVYYRKWSIYSNPENFPTLLAGHAVNHFAGNYLIVKVSAQSVLLVTRITACAEQHHAFFRAYLNVKHAIRFTYPVVNTSNTALKATYRLQDITTSVFKLLCETFKLSMRYMDALAVLSFSPATTDEGVKESFYNIIQSIDSLSENKQQLLAALDTNKQLISTILKPLPGGFTVDVLISGVSSTLNGAEWVSGAVKGSSIWRGLTNVLHSALITLDLPSPFFPYLSVGDPSLAKRTPFPDRKLVTLEL